MIRTQLCYLSINHASTKSRYRFRTLVRFLASTPTQKSMLGGTVVWILLFIYSSGITDKTRNNTPFRQMSGNQFHTKTRVFVVPSV